MVAEPPLYWAVHGGGEGMGVDEGLDDHMA